MSNTDGVIDIYVNGASVRKAVCDPPWWLMVVAWIVTAAVFINYPGWSAGLFVILGAMAGEKDAARRIKAALRGRS